MTINRDFYDRDSYDSECEELRLQASWERQYRNRLLRAPDCRDPDHIGCPKCNEELMENDDE